MIKRVQVKETFGTWTGELRWTEGTSLQWVVVRPDDYGTHTRRGSCAKDYDRNLISVPLFLAPHTTVTELPA